VATSRSWLTRSWPLLRPVCLSFFWRCALACCGPCMRALCLAGVFSAVCVFACGRLPVGHSGLLGYPVFGWGLVGNRSAASRSGCAISTARCFCVFGRLVERPLGLFGSLSCGTLRLLRSSGFSGVCGFQHWHAQNKNSSSSGSADHSGCQTPSPGPPRAKCPRSLPRVRGMNLHAPRRSPLSKTKSGRNKGFQGNVYHTSISCTFSSAVRVR